MVEYTYDAWGNIISITDTSGINLSEINPYRYRGYRYDEETNLYYLNSRYYNPEIGRFINTDGLIGETGDILGHNLYAYCQNNPVMMVDPSGDLAWFVIPIAIAIASGGTQMIVNHLIHEPLYKHVAGAVIGGGFGTYNVWGGAWLYASINQLEDQMFYNESFSLKEYLTDFSLTGIIGTGAGMLGRNLIKNTPIVTPLVENLLADPITILVDRTDEMYDYVKDFVKDVENKTEKAYNDFKWWIIDNTLKTSGDF